MTIFCKDCKFCVPGKDILGRMSYKKATCAHPAVLNEDNMKNEPEFLVTGDLPNKTPVKCSYARKWNAIYCTSKAIFFEPRTKSESQ